MRPALSFLYGLQWRDLVEMPSDDLLEYIDQIPHWKTVASAGMFEEKERWDGT